MNYNMLDLHRFFRNRFESYVDRNDTSGSYVNDGVPLTLRNICEMLEDDIEPFPRAYDQDIRKLCDHEYLIWFRDVRTYGNVARLMTYLLGGVDEFEPVSCGSNMNHADETLGELVVSGCNGAVDFQPTKHPLD